ncbi:hypothetical protein GCM10009733_020760 [Nonomuraea maheshkhaliensis]|uniref:UBP-type domain-containing protein n=1 Tax=Nonomuraea maheshkhaliensis TaxID=419590 RepID=A0ABN2EZK0_9ACTN
MTRPVFYEQDDDTAGQPTATMYWVPLSAPNELTEAQAKELDPTPGTATLCNECEEWINDANSAMCNIDHAPWCSLYPKVVLCKVCGKLADRAMAHRHDGGWVGHESCWEERLRATE